MQKCAFHHHLVFFQTLINPSSFPYARVLSHEPDVYLCGLKVARIGLILIPICITLRVDKHFHQLHEIREVMADILLVDELRESHGRCPSG